MSTTIFREDLSEQDINADGVGDYAISDCRIALPYCSNGFPDTHGVLIVSSDDGWRGQAYRYIDTPGYFLGAKSSTEPVVLIRKRQPSRRLSRHCQLHPRHFGRWSRLSVEREATG
jgi:hypothetical protein